MISWFERNSGATWLIVLLVAAGIFYVSSISFEVVIPGSPLKAIAYHLFVFFVLAGFLLMAVVGRRKKAWILVAVVMAILYGISDEIHQFFVIGRSMSLEDVFIDSVGVVFATMIYLIVLVWRENSVVSRQLNKKI